MNKRLLEQFGKQCERELALSESRLDVLTKKYKNPLLKEGKVRDKLKDVILDEAVTYEKLMIMSEAAKMEPKKLQKQFKAMIRVNKALLSHLDCDSLLPLVDQINEGALDALMLGTSVPGQMKKFMSKLADISALTKAFLAISTDLESTTSGLGAVLTTAQAFANARGNIDVDSTPLMSILKKIDMPSGNEPSRTGMFSFLKGKKMERNKQVDVFKTEIMNVISKKSPAASRLLGSGLKDLTTCMLSKPAAELKGIFDAYYLDVTRFIDEQTLLSLSKTGMLKSFMDMISGGSATARI